jgi:nitrate reductase gamma subunit
MNTRFYKILFIAGITLICISPFLLYLAPVWFGRSLCHPEDYSQQASVWPCADVYIPFAIGAGVITLIIGCLMVAMANRLLSENLKK